MSRHLWYLVSWAVLGAACGLVGWTIVEALTR